MFVVDFCSWLKNRFIEWRNEDVLCCQSCEQALWSTDEWAPHKMQSVRYLLVHCGHSDASVLHHPVPGMLPAQGMHSGQLRSYPLVRASSSCQTSLPYSGDFPWLRRNLWVFLGSVFSWVSSMHISCNGIQTSGWIFSHSKAAAPIHFLHCSQLTVGLE